ncbi:MAG: tRNA (adenosine(37)-N6)-dimethylallyltransferase MiaA [Chlamydiia bacterium]
MNSKNTYPYNSLFLAGPTAAGKTSVAIELAKRLNGEVITVDSAQVYRGMDIGTAKPSIEQRDGVVHHLIDVQDVHKPFNVSLFLEHVELILRDMETRGVFPIFAGGTGLYFQALYEGLPTTPPSQPSVRNRLELLQTADLYQLLLIKDPAYAKTITSNDRNKIIRANEILIITQKKVSDFQERTKSDRLKTLNPKAFFIYRPREVLYERLNLRAKQMCENGLIDEVQALVQKGIELNVSAKKAISYQQPLKYLKGEVSYEKMLQELQQANRQYAKRQFTWFKRMEYFCQVNLEEIGETTFVDLVLKEFFLPNHEAKSELSSPPLVRP